MSVMTLFRRDGKACGAEKSCIVFKGGCTDRSECKTLMPEGLRVRKVGDAVEVFRLLVRETPSRDGMHLSNTQPLHEDPK